MDWRTSSRPSSALCSSAALTRPCGPSSAPSTPTPARSCKLIDPGHRSAATAEWEAARTIIAEAMEKYEAGGEGGSGPHKTRAGRLAAVHRTPEGVSGARPCLRLRQFPLPRAAGAQGLGAPRQPRGRALGLQRAVIIESSPANVLGIEINSYAAELARVTVWIGEIQWMLSTATDFSAADPGAARSHRVPRRVAEIADGGR